jgi:hypothetical protein
MQFKDQYKHPLWQKKRLEALEYAGFRCESCESTEDQLHVHHRVYVKGRLIWDYEVTELSVLCHSCHEQAHVHIERFRQVQMLIPPSMIGRAAQLLEGWADYQGLVSPSPGLFGTSDPDAFDPDAFYAGQLAGYMETELGGVLSDMACRISPDRTEAFIRGECQK